MCKAGSGDSPCCQLYRLSRVQMQLVIYGKEDLDTLVDYADTMFSSVEDRHVARPAFAPKTSFPQEYNGKIVYFVPVADEDSLTVFWQVPPLINQYRQQVCVYVPVNTL